MSGTVSLVILYKHKFHLCALDNDHKQDNNMAIICLQFLLIEQKAQYHTKTHIACHIAYHPGVPV